MVRLNWSILEALHNLAVFITCWGLIRGEDPTTFVGDLIRLLFFPHGLLGKLG